MSWIVSIGKLCGESKPRDQASEVLIRGLSEVLMAQENAINQTN